MITGSKGGGGKQHTPVEMEDNLISINRIKILLAVSDGECDPDFSLKNLYFDDVPVQNEDGTFNYDRVKAEFRPGTQDQSYIQGFADTASEVTVARDITTKTPYVIPVTNKTLSAIRIKMFMPQGVTQEDDGDLVGVRVEYAVDIAIDGGAYNQVLLDVIDGKTTSGYDRSRRIDLPDFNEQVLIRVRRVTLDSTSARVTDTIRLQSYAEVIDAKFRYPLTGLVYVEFDSELFPNQLPVISTKKRWKIINVPTNYDPINRTYSGSWNGLFKKAWSNNPAWVLFDLITNQRYGLDQRELGIEIDKWSLYEVGQYCDQMVPDGKGGKEPRYLCDVVIQSQAEAYQLVRDICSIFRGMTFWNGESLSVVVDKPREPSYIFTNDNVVNGDFNYTFASEKSMYTQCNVTFDDEQNMYQQDVEGVFEPEAALRFGYNATSITAIGCTRRSEANRRGRWILKTNVRSTTVNFATGLEGMIPMVGDVIAISDNFWSSNLTLNLSGRVQEVSGLQVFVPFKVDARAGDYIVINKPDGKPVKRTISRVSDDGKTIEVNVGFGFDVKQDVVFAIDRTDLALQQYVVTTITKGDNDEEFTYNITAVEYDPNKYDEIDLGVNIDDRPTSVVPPDVFYPPENVKLSSYSRVVQGLSVETMVVSWDKVDYASYYEMQWRKGEGNWNNTPRTSSQEVEVEGIYAGNYQVRVRTVSSIGSTSGWSEIVRGYLTGKVGEPTKPINLIASDNEVFGIRVKWGMPDGSGDTAYIELQQAPDSGSLPDEEHASLLTLVPYPQYEYWHSILPAGLIRWYRVRAVDKIGNVSDWTDFVRGQSSTDTSDITDSIVVDIENSEGFKYLKENAIDTNAKLQSSAESIIENALANDGDVRRMRKENGKRKAEYAHAVQLIADETQARVEAVEQLKASIDDEVVAGLTEVKQAIAKEEEARVSADTALSARVDDTQASLNQKMDAWVDAESAGTIYGVNLGLEYQGQKYNAGMAMSIEAKGDQVKSQVLFDADRFAITNTTGDTLVAPFIIENNQVFANSLLVKDGSITNAMIGEEIKSNNFVTGQTGWRINKNGQAEFSQGVFRGDVYANNGHFNGTINATGGNFTGTVNAQRFVGDIMVGARYPDLPAQHTDNTTAAAGQPGNWRAQRFITYNPSGNQPMTIMLSTMVKVRTRNPGVSIAIRFVIGGASITRLIPNLEIDRDVWFYHTFSADIGVTYSPTTCWVSVETGSTDRDFAFATVATDIIATAFRSNNQASFT